MLTKQRSMRHGSVPTVLGRGHHGSDSLFLNPREGGCSKCNVNIVITDSIHSGRIDGHNPNNRRFLVINLSDPRHSHFPFCFKSDLDTQISGFVAISLSHRSNFPSYFNINTPNLLTKLRLAIIVATLLARRRRRQHGSLLLQVPNQARDQWPHPCYPEERSSGHSGNLWDLRHQALPNRKELKVLTVGDVDLPG